MFEPHSQKQDEAIFSRKPFNVIATGIQWGKTISGAWWLRNQCAEFWTYNHIITAPTYKILSQATIPAFISVFKGVGEHKKGDQEFHLNGGGIIYLRTETDPESIVGITNVKSVWGDEAGLYRLYFWQNMQARAARLNGRICLTTSPYSLNWIFKELIKPTLEGKRDDVHLTAAKSIDNPYFSKAFYDNAKKTMDPRRFNALFNGQFEKMQGLVYDCFNEERNSIGHFDIDNAEIYAGVDWGHNDPTVCIIWAITPSGHRIQISEFYKTGMRIGEVTDMLKSKQEIFKVKRFYCDPSKPDMIAELQSRGVRAIGSNNEIDRGIELLYELIKTEKYLILKDSSPYTIDEYDSYHWPEPKDLKPDEDAKKEKPVDQNNHCMDVNRYLALSTHHIGKRKSDSNVPKEYRDPETTPERLSRLMRPRKKNYEKFT